MAKLNLLTANPNLDAQNRAVNQRKIASVDDPPKLWSLYIVTHGLQYLGVDEDKANLLAVAIHSTQN